MAPVNSNNPTDAPNEVGDDGIPPTMPLPAPIGSRRVTEDMIPTPGRNLLPPSSRPPRHSRRWWLAPGLGCVVLMCVFIVFNFNSLENRNQALLPPPNADRALGEDHAIQADNTPSALAKEPPPAPLAAARVPPTPVVVAPPPIASKPTPKRVPRRAEPENTPTPVDEFAGIEEGEERVIADMTFCWCPPGRFTMGSADEEDGRVHDEQQTLV